MCFQETLSASDWTIWHFHRFTGWCEGLEGSSRGHLVHPPSQHGPIRAGCAVPCVKDSHSFSYKLPFQLMQMISEIKINKQTNIFSMQASFSSEIQHCGLNQSSLNSRHKPWSLGSTPGYECWNITLSFSSVFLLPFLSGISLKPVRYLVKGLHFAMQVEWA